MTTETNQAPDAEQQCANASFLLGMAMSALYAVQSELIQDNAKDALKAVSDAIRILNPKIEKAMYSHLTKAPEVQDEPV